MFHQVWLSLLSLESAGADLWNQVSDRNLSNFADRFREARESIRNNGIFFTEADYDALEGMLQAADFYLSGKTTLADIRQGPVIGFVDSRVRRQILQNKRWLTRYRNLLDEMRSRIHRRIAG